METKHSIARFDYSKCTSDDFSYFGLHRKKGRVSVDVKRFKKVCEENGRSDFWKEGMNKTRNTVYLVPLKIHKDDYLVNSLLDIVDKLKKDWDNEFLPAIRKIKKPSEVAEEKRLDSLQETCCSEDYDEIQVEADMEGFKRSAKYNEVITSLFFGYIHKIASEMMRGLVIALRKNGSNVDDFNNKRFLVIIGEINETGQKVLSGVSNYNTFNLLRLTDNFLKHNTKSAFYRLKKAFPKMVTDSDYENGEYAQNYLYLSKYGINNLLTELTSFYKDFCKKVFKEDIESAVWNYDDYFYTKANEIRKDLDIL